MRKPITLAVATRATDYEFGGWSWSAGTSPGVKSSSRWILTMWPTVSRFYTPAQFVTSPADAAYDPPQSRRFILAPLHQTSDALETPFNATVWPTLSLEMYVQPLLASRDDGGARQFVAPQANRFEP